MADARFDEIGTRGDGGILGRRRKGGNTRRRASGPRGRRQTTRIAVSSQAGDANKKEFAWLSQIAATVRACGARQPITIGTMNGGNITTFAPIVDVLCAHPYARDRKGLEGLIEGYKPVREAAGKPLLVNECIPGALDDAVRAEAARYYTELLSKASFGWMGWALREGKAVSTRRDRCDGNGIHNDGFHPFFTREGRLRAGLEFLTAKPAQVAPWEKPGV